ncbi:MAG TPA: response regulator [Ferruginibacter sp.]|jgi:CheY-like chemotaxis protein/CHASE3 domain sensor protein|nr:response regulator [Ferruginibacter sp.]
MQQTALKRNLLIGFSISLLILIFSSVASYVSIKNLLASAQLVDHSTIVSRKAADIISTMKDAETGQRGFLLTKEPEFLEPYNGRYNMVIEMIAQLKELTKDNPTQQVYADELNTIIVKRFSMLQDLIDERKNGAPINVEGLREGKAFMDSTRAIVNNIETEEQSLLAKRTVALNKFAAFTPVLIIIAALLALLITIIFYLKVRKDINDKIKLQEALEEKDRETTARIDVIQNIAEKISAGNFGIRVSDEEKDNLGSLAFSLNKMASSLEDFFEKLSDKEWLQTGVARLNEAMIGDDNIETLTQKILASIAEYSDSLVGAFYLLENDNQLLLQNGFALAKGAPEKIKMGEGLIGSCAVTKQEILVNNISEKDIKVSFASVELMPVTIMVFPVLFEREIKGVIEIGALHPYTQRELEYFRNISENIGISINTVQNRQRVQALLEETQSQSEELMSQHSELEHMNSELEAQAEELQASEEELKVQQEELLEINSTLEERTSLLEDRTHLVQEKNAEIQKRMEELALSTKYKSEFLANMSHELRTPLNSILLLSRLMSENNEKNLTVEQVQYANVIQSSGNGLLELIDEILDLSKIEAGKMSVEYLPVAVQDIIEEVKSLFDPVAKQKNIDWKVTLGEKVPSLIETDKLRLLQIVKNLLSNSFKFTHEGFVHLIIDIPEDKLSFISFTVKDSGIGIASEKQQLIFDAFQQEDGSTRRKYGGTGLGLSISRELSRLLGGEINLSSKIGEGSEFKLYLPLTKEVLLASNEMLQVAEKKNNDAVAEEIVTNNYLQYTATDIPEEIEDDRNSISEKDKVILIIEDDTAFAKALLDYTRQKGYKGLVAVRGDKGLEMARQYNLQGILLDIQLPVKNGWEVIDELKKNPKTRHIPVHIMSSFQLKKESLVKGAVDFINKPVAFEQLNTIFEKIEYVLSKKEKKVLIVEDNYKHAKALAYFLSTYNVNTETFQTVEESIQSLHKNNVDCVILDMGVPDMKAYDLLEKVKQQEGLENIPVIIFTGKSLSSREELRIKQYADTIVLKTAHSYQRILDEVSIFLHLVEDRKMTKATIGIDKSGVLENVLKNKTVLLADDDVRNIFSMTKALEKHNMKVIPAMDGKEALQLLKSHPEIDVVLMDMMMPEMDGYESIKAIRKNPLTKNIPVIAVTAKAMTGDREKCIAVGASDYISKPVDIDQLVSLLRIWLYEKGY